MLHLTWFRLRGTLHPQIIRWIGPMRDFFVSLKKIGVAFGVLSALLAFAPATFVSAAYAANPLELNFGLFGPGYEGRVANCESALPTITSEFQEKESGFWNSSLQITGYDRVRETAFRPWESDNMPRRYCTAEAMLNDGKARVVHYSIIEDGGFAGYGQGVEWCIVGLDRNWAYNPSCRSARP